MTTEIMYARFIGNENDKGTQEIWLMYQGCYSLRLLHPNWLQRLLGEKGVTAKVRVMGDWHYIVYESIQAFDRNWIIKNNRTI